MRTIGKQDDDADECGMDEPSGSREGVTGLLLGEPNHKWRFGSGFTFGTFLIRTKLQLQSTHFVNLVEYVLFPLFDFSTLCIAF